MTKVQITIKSVYGRETIYPVCKLAQGFARIAGTKTLTEDTVRTIVGMGFQIEYVDAFSLKYAATDDKFDALRAALA
jgi:hypothetical protein